MSAAKDIKRQQIEDIKAKIEKAGSIVLVGYKGITVEQDTKLRSKFRAENVEYRVLKNRLVKIAFNEMGITCFDKELENTTAFAFGYGDIIAPAKILKDSLTEIKCLEIRSGMVEGKYLDTKAITAVASIPSKNVLVAQVLGLLQGTIASFARVINAIAEQKSEINA